MAIYSCTRTSIFVLSCLLQIAKIVLTCTESNTCFTNISLYEGCSYNITLLNVTGSMLVPVHITFANESHTNINETVEEISLVSNGLCNVSTFDMKLPNLDIMAINLQNNSINDININVKPINVNEINLSMNKLQSIHVTLFNNYTKLVKLFLNKNEIVNIAEGSFSGLTSLETLDLSENKLRQLPNVFEPLKSLQNLNLSRNNIEFIHESYLNNWLLQNLDISQNNLKKVAPGALQLLPNLARLLLADNPHLGITQLDTQLLVGTGRRLQQIDASRTGLFQVPEAFTHSVRFLSLVGNKIPTIRRGDLDTYPLLQSLDFSDNKIIIVEDDSLGRLEMLFFLNINKNILTTVPKTLPVGLKYLSISNNLIKNLTKNDLRNMPKLRILLLQNNKIRYIENNVFDDLLLLEMLDLSNNPIQTIKPGAFDGPVSLKDLRLCFINATVMETNGNFPVSSPESIQMLHLQSSPSLARQLLADSAALTALSRLQYLDLRMNNISEIQKDSLLHLDQLKTLRLHGNSINCSADLWKEWMTRNKSLSNETCYFSTTQNKEDDAKYNCTFSETFTINESLPPVNLYSTEMINKLLRYYGYSNNKTDNVSFKNNNNSYPQIRENNTTDTNVQIKDSNYKNNGRSSHTPELQLTKEDMVNILDQNEIQSNQVGFDNHYNDIRHNFIDVSEADKYWIDIKKNKTGKRLNTPVNVTKHHDRNIYNISNNVHNNETETFTVHSMIQTEYSSYHATASNYAQYIASVSLSVLIVISLILWASFRLRYRRRRNPESTCSETADQIEVSNISGGVLW